MKSLSLLGYLKAAFMREKLGSLQVAVGSLVGHTPRAIVLTLTWLPLALDIGI